MNQRTQKIMIITLAVLSLLALISTMILPYLPMATGE